MRVITQTGSYALPEDAEQFVIDFTMTSLALARFGTGGVDAETSKYVEAALERIRFLQGRLTRKRLTGSTDTAAEKLSAATGESVEQLSALFAGLMSVLERRLAGVAVSDEEIWHASLTIGTIINGGISTLDLDGEREKDCQAEPSLISRVKKMLSPK